MMPLIEIEIKNCQGCPHFDSKRKYKSGRDFVAKYTWVCKKQDKIIQDNVEWDDIENIKVPDWCPCLVKEVICP